MSRPVSAPPSKTSAGLSLSTVASTWWPLAASWLLMGVEMPIVAAVLGRLPQSEFQLAAFGGIVFPVALLIESPVIMLLAASVRLSDSPKNFRFLQRFSRILGISLTAVHGLVAFTPLFDVLVVPLLDPPVEIIESARLSFQCMLPFTWAVAERRFHQGLLIRFGRQRQVGIGTVLRLVSMVTTILLLAWFSKRLGIEGAALGALAISVGVVAEAIFARSMARRVERGPLAALSGEGLPLNLRRTMHFYVPLALTAMMTLAAQPIGSAGMNRMPEALASLAIWPALGGLSFFLRSTGIAFNEVVIRHAPDPGSLAPLRRFAFLAGVLFSLATILFATSPGAQLWYLSIEGLSPELLDLAQRATWAIVPLPILTFMASYWQGLLVDQRRTRAVSEGVGIGLGVTSVVLVVLASTDWTTGAVGASLALTLGAAAQCGWLWHRARPITTACDAASRRA